MGTVPVVPGKTFVSYSHRDTGTYVTELVRFLETNGVAVWSDHDLDPGAPLFAQALAKRIDDSTAVVVVMSPEAEKSEWVQLEIARARQVNKRILPLLLNGPVFFIFGTSNYSDVHDGRMPPESFVILLQDHQFGNSTEAAERSAKRLFTRPDGVSEPYQRAVAIAGTPVAASVQPGAGLAPLPASASSVDALQAFVGLAPAGVDYLERLAEAAMTQATRTRREADARVAALASAETHRPRRSRRRRPLTIPLWRTSGSSRGSSSSVGSPSWWRW